MVCLLELLNLWKYDPFWFDVCAPLVCLKKYVKPKDLVVYYPSTGRDVAWIRSAIDNNWFKRNTDFSNVVYVLSNYYVSPDFIFYIFRDYGFSIVEIDVNYVVARYNNHYIIYLLLDNNCVLKALEILGAKLCCFIGKNDGCRSWANYECVNNKRWLSRIAKLMVDGGLYITDHFTREISQICTPRLILLTGFRVGPFNFRFVGTCDLPLRPFFSEKLFMFKIQKTKFKEKIDNESSFSVPPELRSHPCLNLKAEEIHALLEIIELIINKRGTIKDILHYYNSGKNLNSPHVLRCVARMISASKEININEAFNYLLDIAASLGETAEFTLNLIDKLASRINMRILLNAFDKLKHEQSFLTFLLAYHVLIRSNCESVKDLVTEIIKAPSKIIKYNAYARRFLGELLERCPKQASQIIKEQNIEIW